MKTSNEIKFLRDLSSVLDEADIGHKLCPSDDDIQYILFPPGAILVGCLEPITLTANFEIGIDGRTDESLRQLRHSFLPRWKNSSEINIIVVEGDPGNLGPRVNAALERHVKAVRTILTQKDQVPLKNTQTPRALRKLLVQNLKPKRIMPYRVGTPAKERVFVGRNDEIAKIRDTDRHMFIYGARRIGKTSLVIKYKKNRNRRALAKTIQRGTHMIHGFVGSQSRTVQLYDRGVRPCAYIDVGLVVDYNDLDSFFLALLRAFGISDPTDVLRRKLPENDPHLHVEAFRSLLIQIKDRVEIILDECDHWLADDRENGWKILSALRSMVDANQHRIIFVGYETLLWLAKAEDFPFYNRAQHVWLMPLSRPEVEELVQIPMEELGVKFADRDQAIERIWRVSRGQPEIVHAICYQLCEVYFQNNREVVTEQLVHQTIGSEMVREMLSLEHLFHIHPFAALVAMVTANSEADDGVLNADDSAKQGESAGYGLKKGAIFRLLDDLLERLDYVVDDISLKDRDYAITHLVISGVLSRFVETNGTHHYRWANQWRRELFLKACEGGDFDYMAKSCIKEGITGEWRALSTALPEYNAE